MNRGDYSVSDCGEPALETKSLILPLVVEKDIEPFICFYAAIPNNQLFSPVQLTRGQVRQLLNQAVFTNRFNLRTTWFRLLVDRLTLDVVGFIRLQCWPSIGYADFQFEALPGAHEDGRLEEAFTVVAAEALGRYKMDVVSTDCRASKCRTEGALERAGFSRPPLSPMRRLKSMRAYGTFRLLASYVYDRTAWLAVHDPTMADATSTFIEIVAAPKYGPPEWVRNAWIGCKLPIYDAYGTEPMDWSASFGRYLRIPSWLPIERTGKHFGYVVPADAAFRILMVHNPPAAQWWRANKPAMFGSGAYLIFDPAACRLIPNSAPTSPPDPHPD